MPSKKHLKPKDQLKLICNPQAGDPQDPSKRLEEVTYRLHEAGWKVSVSLAKPKEKAEKIARKAVKQGYRTVVVLGGDGTIEAAARALVKTKTRLGILPGGTENNLVKSLGIPEDMDAAIQLLRDGQTRKIDVGQIKVKKKKMTFIELAAVGLVAQIFPDAKKIPDGSISKIGAVIGEIVQYKMPRFKLTIDGESHLKEELAARDGDERPRLWTHLFNLA